MSDLPSIESTGGTQPSGENSVEGKIGARQDKLENLMHYVVIVLVMMTAALVVAVIGVLNDALHFNSAVYTEYSNKLDLANQISSTTKMIHEQNKNYQELILMQQQQIIQLLNR